MRASTWLLLLSLPWFTAACGNEEAPAPADSSAGENTPVESPVTPPAETPENSPIEELPIEGPVEDPAVGSVTPPEEDPAEEAAPSHSEAAVAAADAKFASICATCHGPEGRGDAPAAAGFPVKPKDLSDPDWQASVDDEYLAKIITEGGPAVGKNGLMTGAPDLKDKPEVLAALISKIRGFGK